MNRLEPSELEHYRAMYRLYNNKIANGGVMTGGVMTGGRARLDGGCSDCYGGVLIGGARGKKQVKSGKKTNFDSNIMKSLLMKQRHLCDTNATLYDVVGHLNKSDMQNYKNKYGDVTKRKMLNLVDAYYNSTKKPVKRVNSKRKVVKPVKRVTVKREKIDKLTPLSLSEDEDEDETFYGHIKAIPSKLKDIYMENESEIVKAIPKMAKTIYESASKALTGNELVDVKMLTNIYDDKTHELVDVRDIDYKLTPNEIKEIDTSKPLELTVSELNANVDSGVALNLGEPATALLAAGGAKKTRKVRKNKYPSEKQLIRLGLNKQQLENKLKRSYSSPVVRSNLRKRLGNRYETLTKKNTCMIENEVGPYYLNSNNSCVPFSVAKHKKVMNKLPDELEYSKRKYKTFKNKKRGVCRHPSLTGKYVLKNGLCVTARSGLTPSEYAKYYNK